MDKDGEILARAAKEKDFFGSVFYKDSLDDWTLAKELGEFLIRIEPDSEILGHALLARACRHLGDAKRAFEELQQCRNRIVRGELTASEKELFLPVLAKEEELLSGGR